MECRIQFLDKSLQQFDWCKLEMATGKLMAAGRSSSDELRSICAESQKVVVFVPQQNVLLTAAQFPARANNQQLGAIDYSIEEFLGQDVEGCFVAITAQQADHKVPVAVIDRQIMDDCIQLLSRLNINARYILPQVYLCPWSEDVELLASICPFEEGYLIRTGLHEGLYCHASILQPLLKQLKLQKSAEQNRLDIYASEFELELTDEGLSINRHQSLDLLSQPLNLQHCINLKQKEYQSSHQWLGLTRKWRWPMVAVLLLLLVVISSNLLEVWNKQQILDDLISQQQVLLGQYLPDQEPSSQPKKQLVKTLSENQSLMGKTGFLDLLHEYSQLKAQFSSLTTDKVQYQQSRLIINLEASDLRSMEAFRAKLEASPYAAEIENVSINPDKTTGRLVMREK